MKQGQRVSGMEGRGVGVMSQGESAPEWVRLGERGGGEHTCNLFLPFSQNKGCDWLHCIRAQRTKPLKKRQCHSNNRRSPEHFKQADVCHHMKTRINVLTRSMQASLMANVIAQRCPEGERK